MTPESEAIQLRVLIAGGGTGGHVFPGIAIANGIRKRYPRAEILFVGTRQGLEAKIVPREGFRLETITVSGLKGVKGINKLKGLLAVPKSLWESHRIIRRLRPHVVVGVGGYSSGPPVLMALLAGIPTLLQEQNALPGLTNRLLAHFSSRVATAFKECELYFGKKAVLTGNPIRTDFKRIAPRISEKFVLLIFGGSRGARAINKAMVEALERLRPHFSDMFFIHQTGEKDYDWVSKSYGDLGASSDVRPFFDDMPVQFARADLLLCRSGATTLAEITVAGKAAILVPFPLATDNHQQKNAEQLVKAGAAEMILQRDLTGEKLGTRIEYFYRHRQELTHMEQKSRELGRPDSTERIVDLLEELVHV
ncbi:MAG: undecaprenyldiphospho-muramoylpentapeptide beta-N-acetylglucosaminyltransferase [Acidobacteria bacterium]|nr:MAG: undecaprenyldiphospho-muramoylpentapeptide beta-N-acetylglucosaminyltransferase [Acidobacteriota bacterium]